MRVSQNPTYVKAISKRTQTNGAFNCFDLKVDHSIDGRLLAENHKEKTRVCVEKLGLFRKKEKMSVFCDLIYLSSVRAYLKKVSIGNLTQWSNGYGNRSTAQCLVQLGNLQFE